ncbi:major facilitator superfamily domain-containing protein [Dichotomopilus funicola]|uniref:Major facilitator superfamily domain-containing protein n=1 Tax=Dichotomopilus funicola TaxID=1934379 RepID=A0AAN6ZNL0_9PEZI|nr:major facilitator superfamily domain-containing protein [Dichotomopilus funicola]
MESSDYETTASRLKADDAAIDAEKAQVQPESDKQDEPKQDEPERAMTGFRWFAFVVSTLTAIFVYALDNTIVANIIPVIVNDLNGIEKLPWLSVGFMIGGLAIILPVGKLYATYNPKWVYIVSFIIFLAASALCGAAPTIEAEIVGRVLAGAGGNGIYYGLLALLSMHTTSKERPQYLSYTGLVWGLGTVLGPVVGGGFALWNWRWGFYINLLFGAILLPAYLLVIPSTPVLPDKTQWQKLAMLDWVGALLSIGAMVTLVIGINFGGVDWAWNSGASIALFVVSGVLWIAFGAQQSLCVLTTKEKRLFPVHLLSQKMPVLLFVACASVAAVAYTSVYYIPLYFQFSQGDSAIYTAVRLLPYICVLITAMPLSGWYLSRYGWYKPLYIGGSLVALVTSALMAHYVDRETPVGIFYIIELFLGGSTGAYTQSSFAVVQAVLPPDEAGNGLALMLISQLGGMTLALSISGAVFINTAVNNLESALELPRLQITQLVAGASNNLLESLSPAMRDLTLDTIVASWQKAFIIVYVGAAASFVVSLFFRHGKANIVAVGGL